MAGGGRLGDYHQSFGILADRPLGYSRKHLPPIRNHQIPIPQIADEFTNSKYGGGRFSFAVDPSLGLFNL